MEKTGKHDPFLQGRLDKYDEWLNEGQISFSSKVVPVLESLEAKQWVLPTEQVLEILRKAKTIAVLDCECRSHYKRCNKPLEVCLVLNEHGDKLVDKDEARHVSLAEVKSILQKANESGLVHLSLYMPHHQVWALCSCCPCCCHELQIVKQFGRNDLMVHSEYIAETDMEVCIHCGECIERCIFGARELRDGQMVYTSEACLGCGLCISGCSVEAISMNLRKSYPE